MRCSLLFVLIVAGCIEGNLVVCDDGRACPAGTTCDERHASCVDPEQVTVCAGHPDGDPCQTIQIANGVCFGVCIPAGCGNGEVESGEMCDGGNTVSGDGCAADCMSEERCGDGFVDHNRAEDCDDGNTRGHDGCSSVCALEEKRWVMTGALPPGRAGAAVAYDSIRRRIVVFGGEDAANSVDRDTWEWDGAAWIAVSPIFAPPARTRAEMAFDPIRRRIVMFGGNNADGIPLSDTWEWDGSTWTARPSLVMPPERAGATMAWDPTLRAVVLFGGTTFFRVYDDTWTWDGQVWTQLEPATLPTNRLEHAMAFDTARNRMVIAGGLDATAQPVLDSWAFDGTTWTQLGSAPPALRNISATYDPIRAKVVLAGLGPTNTWETWELGDGAWTHVQGTGEPSGVFGTNLVFDLDAQRAVAVFGQARAGDYTAGLAGWNGATWSAITPQPFPAARFNCGLALDPVRDRFVMFGGSTDVLDVAAAWDRTTWEWDSVRWTQVSTTGPAKRFGHALLHDGHAVLLFGGDIGGAPTNETWTWDGQTWTRHDVTPSPPPRSFAAMAFDSARGRAVLFGGTTVSDTWEWDGTRWYDVTPAVVPPPRERTAMAYDTKRHRVVMFGGTNADLDTYLDDAWEWDGTTWTDVTTALRPEARYGHQLIYDPIRERSVLLAGVPLLSFSEWEWDGTRWTQPSTTNTPFPRQGMCAAYDHARHQIVGYSGGFYVPLAEQWSAAYNGSDEEVCRSGIDGDGDTQIGCDDEDCAFVCTACGDGTCGPMENDRLCPNDCPASSPICGDGYCAPGEAATCPSDC